MARARSAKRRPSSPSRWTFPGPRGEPSAGWRPAASWRWRRRLAESLGALAGAGVPAALANGRISDRSYRRYRRVRPLFRRVLAQIGLFAMQSDEDARRVISLGAGPERVVVTGNLKMEAPAESDGTGELWRRLLHVGEDPVFVAGSTHRGEEGPVLDAFQAGPPGAPWAAPGPGASAPGAARRDRGPGRRPRARRGEAKPDQRRVLGRRDPPRHDGRAGRPVRGGRRHLRRREPGAHRRPQRDRARPPREAGALRSPHVQLSRRVGPPPGGRRRHPGGRRRRPRHRPSLPPG